MPRTICCVSTLFILLIGLLSSQSVFGQDIVINWTDRGWYNDLGTHDPNNDNYSVGDVRGRVCGGSIYCSNDLHNFFVFNLSSVTKTIASAKLALAQGSYISDDPSETYEMHDVTTSITTLRAGSSGNATGIATWNDLGTGIVYGSFEFTPKNPVDRGAVFEIPLNVSAIAAMNANHGLFAIGGRLTSLDDLTTSEQMFAQTGGVLGNSTTQLRITYVPEPSTLFLLAIGAISLFGRRKRQRTEAIGRRP
jgi:hypothetical protein